MGLCNPESKKKRPFKTIIIPKGIINPNENNIIEIPLNMDTDSSLIVKAPNDASLVFSVEPYRGKIANMKLTENLANPLYSEMYGTEADNPEDRNTSNDRNQNEANEKEEEPPEPAPVMDYNNQSQTKFQQPYVFDSDFSSQSTSRQKPLYYPMGMQRPSQSVNRQTQQFTQEAHSPICPICAKSSCKYLNNAGINRTFSSKYSHFSPSLYTPQKPNFREYISPSYIRSQNAPYLMSFPTVLPNTRSEISPQKRNGIDEDILNKTVEEKIEKALKPVLNLLGNILPKNNEKCQAPSSCVKKKPSCSSIQSSRSCRDCSDQESDFSCQSFRDDRSKPRNYNCPSSRKSPNRDCQYRNEPRRNTRIPCSYQIFNKANASVSSKYSDALTSLSSRDSDFEDAKNEAMLADRDSSTFYNTSSLSGSPKKINVSFGEKDKTISEPEKFNELHRTGKNDIFNSSFIASSSRTLKRDDLRE